MKIFRYHYNRFLFGEEPSSKVLHINLKILTLAKKQ